MLKICQKFNVENKQNLMLDLNIYFEMAWHKRYFLKIVNHQNYQLILKFFKKILLLQVKNHKNFTYFWENIY